MRYTSLLHLTLCSLPTFFSLSTTAHHTADIQHVLLNFTSRGQAGAVAVTIQPNTDNETGFGLDLIYPGEDIPLNFHGFPVVHGAITYPIPANPTSGYGSLFGWIQFIKNNTVGQPDGPWGVDSYPYAGDLNDPFGGWGYNPSHFDAPAILWDEDNDVVSWSAQTYLCVLEGAGVYKNVTVFKGAGFTWGYNQTVDSGNSSVRSIAVTKATLLDVGTEWEDRLPLLKGQYPEWTFQDVPV
jgi:hypothetical protein